MDGGKIVAEVLSKQGVRFLFTLCGGHISPILTSCEQKGIRVIDVRHEVNTVFAADAVSRLTGIPGVAAVTAGPGVTNTLTAVKNAQMAQSPLVLLGGATATLLHGKGALQDINQIQLIKPHVKWTASAKRIREIAPLLEKAFVVAKSGVPGPVFVELPIDLLFPEVVVRDMFLGFVKGKGMIPFLSRSYLNIHLKRIFHASPRIRFDRSPSTISLTPDSNLVEKAIVYLSQAKRPLLLIGSQAMLAPSSVGELRRAVESLNLPVYLTGMARGLLGANSSLQFRHQRKLALQKADLVILAGLPNDFRLGYGRQIHRKATLLSINRSRHDLFLNRRPTFGIHADAGLFLQALCQRWKYRQLNTEWLSFLQTNEKQREKDIQQQTNISTEFLNPLKVCHSINDNLNERSILIADGGDFVGTASYTVLPRNPLSWLDPGAFGTLGVGAGFALGAKLCFPDSEVWILYGDGSVGFSLTEFDTFARHQLGVIALVGNDARWNQIARDQVEILQSDVGTALRRTDYHLAAQGLGGKGASCQNMEQFEKTVQQAKESAQANVPFLINAWLGKTDFRKGSISI